MPYLSLCQKGLKLPPTLLSHEVVRECLFLLQWHAFCAVALPLILLNQLASQTPRSRLLPSTGGLLRTAALHDC